jgi:hypothetical protein
MDKSKLIVLFGEADDAEAALNEIYKTVPEDEMDLRVIDVASKRRDRNAATGWVAGLPVPATGGVVPMQVGITDLEIEDEERRFIMNRAGKNGVVLEISADGTYMPLIRRIVSTSDGQFYTKGD